MPNITLTYNRNNFTKATPSWDTAGEYSNGLRFNTISKTLELDNTNHSLVSFTITPSGDYDFGSVHFSTPNGSIVSVAITQDDLYLPHNLELGPNSHIFKDETTLSSSITYYVIVNGDPDKVTSLLNISIALAKNGSIPNLNPTVDLSWDCSPPGGTIYEYEMGLHTWSPYDAKNDTGDNPTLTTKLYSFTPISNWTSYSNVRVYSSPYFNNPALNYYYGYGDKVYRVGESWSRSYGLRYFYETRVTWHWFFKKKVRTTLKTIGPEETIQNVEWDGNQSWESLACIEPTMRNVGKIRQRYNNNTLIQPEKYRYYLGYHPSIKKHSNSYGVKYYTPFSIKYRIAGPFTQWSYRSKKSYGITGLTHAFSRLITGIVNGYNPSTNGRVPFWSIAGPLGVAALAATGAGGAITLEVIAILQSLPGPFAKVGIWLKKLIESSSTGNWVVAALALLALIITFILALRPRTILSKENCNSFLHHFTSSPYINLNNDIYRDDAFTTKNLGYYSDGVYYYYQPALSGVNSKELSYINAWNLDENNPIFSTEYSFPADNPTSVTNWEKLVLLPYCSGKPIPYCGLDENNNPNPIYSSKAFSHTVEYTCCDLEDCSQPTVISLPEGFVRSCISQADADDQAEEHFSASIEYAENHSSYGQTLDNSLIGQLDVSFTHEIKEEDNPTSLALFYDIRSGSDAPIGTPLYYDHTGCQKALPGYYAVSSSNYPKHYYKVADGEVAAIYTQSAASSTTTTTGQTIIKTDEDKSSNWYLKSNTRSNLSYYIFSTNDRTFDVNSLFTTSPYELSAGRIISGSYTDGAFEKYSTFNSNGITSTTTPEQGTGWYAPLNGWKPESADLFFYQNSLTSFTGGTRYATSGSAICAGSNTGNTYYHDGISTSPGLGDKIYNTNDIDDPTADGFIKYTSDLYMEIEEGVMIDSISCTPSTDFSGSIILDMGNACTASFNAVNYEYNGNTASPEIGDTISRVDSTNVTAGFIRTSTNIYQIDANGVVLQISTCSDLGSWPTDLTVGFNAILNGGNSVWYGYETYDYPTTGIGTGGEYGDIDHKFPYENSLRGYIGWKAVSLVWSSDYNQLEFTMQYPDTSGYGSYVPTAWDILEIEESGGTIHTYNASSATSTNFTDSGKKYYRWTWSENSNPFGGYGTIASVDVYSDIM